MRGRLGAAGNQNSHEGVTEPGGLRRDRQAGRAKAGGSGALPLLLCWVSWKALQMYPWPPTGSQAHRFRNRRPQAHTPRKGQPHALSNVPVALLSAMPVRTLSRPPDTCQGSGPRTSPWKEACSSGLWPPYTQCWVSHRSHSSSLRSSYYANGGSCSLSLGRGVGKSLPGHCRQLGPRPVSDPQGPLAVRPSAGPVPCAEHWVVETLFQSWFPLSLESPSQGPFSLWASMCPSAQCWHFP